MAPTEDTTTTSYSVLLQNTFAVKDFEWTQNEWPSLGHREFSDTIDLPVFSLASILTEGSLIHEDSSLLDEKYLSLSKTLVGAAEKWGFFQVSDHGVPLDLVKKTQETCLKFFDLPVDEKQKGARSSSLPLGYSASNPDYGINLPWTEIIQLQQSPDKIKLFAQRVWGGSADNTAFAETLIQYTLALERLGMAIFQMLAVGLGLEKDHFSKHFTEGDSTLIRINRYPPCPNPGRILGLGQHTDPQSLTLLLQDEVGGLQVLMDGKWVAVKPAPGCFVINVGDTLEAWSNARLRSGIHRAVVNTTTPRLSMAYFLSPALNTIIAPPSELIDEDYPLKYRPFTWLEFQTQLLRQRRVVGKQSLDKYLIESN